MLMQLIMPMLPTYLMTLKGQLSLEVDDEAVNEIWDTVKEMMDGLLSNENNHDVDHFRVLRKILNADNEKAICSLMGVKETIQNAEETKYGMKTDMDIVQMEDGMWSWLEGHKDVKNVEEAVKLFTNWVEA